MNRNGTVRGRPAARSNNCCPDISGITRSVSTSLMFPLSSRRCSSANLPFAASITVYPDCDRMSATSDRTSSWSSATRMTSRLATAVGSLATAATATGPSTVGRHISKHVPRPGALRNSTSPPAWVTMPCTVARPSPVPRPTALVVKNGSNTRAWTSGDMPMPVSVTVRWTAWTPPAGAGGLAVAIVSVPPPGMASPALALRFISTLENWPASIEMSSRVAFRSNSMRMSSRTSRASMACTPVSCACRLSTRGSTS